LILTIKFEKSSSKVCPKLVKCIFVGMIWNCDKISKQNTKLKITLFKFNIYSNLIFFKWHIGAIINIISNKFQNISFEIPLHEKKFFSKGPQKGQWF
jgi:hypothetical protein